MVRYGSPFPHEALRDLIGIARAAYAAETDPARRAELAAVGKSLRDAAELAHRLDTETLGARAAWRRAEEATARLCELVAGDAAALVTAAAARVRRDA